VLDLRLDQKIDCHAAGACTHACIAARLRVIMEACVHRMLYCSAVQSSVDELSFRTLAKS
jgi:hypothetical protein